MILAIVNSLGSIDSIDTSMEDAIYFSWRKDTFKLSKFGRVYVIENDAAIGNSLAILMEKVIRNYWVQRLS